MTSYLSSIDTLSQSRTVFEIFDFTIFRVWPWPLTSKGHLGSKFFIPFKSSYITSYLAFMDTIFLSRTVFEIFRFQNCWGLTLTFNLWRSSGVESVYTNRKPINDFLSNFHRHFLSISYRFREIRVKVFRVKQNGGLWPFQGQGHWPIFFYSRNGSDSHQTASNGV